MRSMVLVTLAILCGCARQPEIGVTEQGVVGGQAETGYSPVGYLMVGSPLTGPDCGVTVIASNAAVTAAHCIALQGGTKNSFGIGLGAVNSGPAYPASQVFVHPQYNPNSTDPQNPRYPHDVAVLLFSQPLPVLPAQIGATAANASLRYIGYGRVTPGDVSVGSGYTGERKSTVENVNSLDGFNIFVTGNGGGLCWGDSGGPLMADGGNTIYGVLADFNQIFDCHVGNQMIFTSLDRESSFIQHALSCAGSTDPSCAPPPCKYKCADYSYAVGQCYQGWRCDVQGCLDYLGTCPVVQTCTPACGGKQCGSDGCGGTCGTCGGSQTCTDVGICQANVVSGTGACAGLTAWDPNRPWYNYATGEQHIGSNNHRYACKNVAYCIYDPISSTGSTYGWTDQGPC